MQGRRIAMNDAAKTRAFLKAHCERYPELALQDLRKALFQSACGCEHLVGDASAAADYIRREEETAPGAENLLHNAPETAVEPLDGPFCRVHLSALRSGLTAETLAKLFALSAEPVPNGRKMLTEKLTALWAAAADGEIPFSAADTAAEIAAWERAGYPACRHSEPFRAAYHPAYRVCKRAYARALPLFAAVDRLLAEKPAVTVAIEGGSASGKTTLAAQLQQVYDGCAVFHMDDFFLRPEQRTPERYAEPGGNVDQERFLTEVLTPLTNGEPVAYRRFDCARQTVCPPEIVQPGRLNVVEGAYSMHPDLAEHYDLSVFLSIDPGYQRARILRRNTQASAERFFSTWIPLETRYFKAFRPMERCTLCLTAAE